MLAKLTTYALVGLDGVATHFGFRSKTILEPRLWTAAALMDMHRIFLPALVLQIYPGKGWGG